MKNGALQSAGSKGSTIIRDTTVKENTQETLLQLQMPQIFSDTFYLLEKPVKKQEQICCINGKMQSKQKKYM